MFDRLKGFRYSGFMNEIPDDAWFYTREGERLGPVTFVELQAKAAEAALHPRLDMVWTQGMEDWKPAGEIENMFMKREPEVKESLAPKADPYKPPTQESVEDVMSKEGNWPGARRRSYLFMTVLFPVLWNVIFMMAAPFLTGQLGPEIMKVIGIVAGFLPMIIIIYISLMRLVNLGMSRWWFLGNLVPLLNFWVGYRCFACPAGYAYHKKLDGAGIALAIIYWLLIVISLLVAAAIIALMFGMIDNPALQEQLREIMRQVQAQAAKP